MNFNNGNGGKKFREVETFSAYGLRNTEGSEPSALSFSFFRELLKLQISPRLPNPSNDKMWDYDNSVVAYLTHIKARILKDQIEEVMAGNIESGGVPTGADGLVTFSNGKEIGSNFYCLILRKIDQNSGVVLSSYVYEFKPQYHYAICNFNQTTAEHDKRYYDELEIEQLKDLLNQYYLAMTNATAYSVVNQMRFDISRLNTKLLDIAKANGIEYGEGNSNNNGNNSFFNKPEQQPRNGGARTATMDDLENQLS